MGQHASLTPERWSAFDRELLRWRDLLAEMYDVRSVDPAGHRAALRALLQLTPTASRQVPLLSGS
jgi:hypothetical protein